MRGEIRDRAGKFVAEAWATVASVVDRLGPIVAAGRFTSIPAGHCGSEDGMRLADVVPEGGLNDDGSGSVVKGVGEVVRQEASLCRGVLGVRRKQDGGVDVGSAIAVDSRRLITEDQGRWWWGDRRNSHLGLAEARGAIVPADIRVKPDLKPWTEGALIERDPINGSVRAVRVGELIDDAGVRAFAIIGQLLQ